MQMQNNNRLRGITLLMSISQLLLLLFIAYWLRSEYLTEEQQLKKELTVELNEVYRDVADSILIRTIIEPSLQGLDTYKFNMYTGEQSMTYKENSGTPINVKSIDQQTADSIQKSISIRYLDSNKHIRMPHTAFKSLRIRKPTTIESQIKNFPHTKVIHSADSTVIYKFDSSEKFELVDTFDSKKMLRSIYTLIAKEIFRDSLGNMTLKIELDDSNRTRNKFMYVLNKNGRNFNADWVSNDTLLQDGRNHFTISVENDKQMEISGYGWHLVKKMSPQILFALLLILSTGLSLLLTYRSLRRQMKLSEMKNGLISNMSHELKTPVSTVKVALEALDNFDVVNQPDKAREYIHMAMLETHRLELLVNKALNTSLMEQGKMTLQRQRHDVLNIVTEIVQALRLRLEQNNTTIHLNSRGDNFVTNVDKLHLQGAVMNIIDNSIKYGRPPVEININVIATDASITIEVKDNGPGIPEAYIEQVFEKFFRVPEGDRHNVKGYGLGLSYVQQVMQLHNGMAKISNHPDGGCLFTLQFFRGR